MTDLSHYRVGPTKTRDGRDAVIYAIYPDHGEAIHGAVLLDVYWRMFTWRNDGTVVSYTVPRPDFDLLPNATNTTVARWLPPDGSLSVSATEREGWTRVEVPVQPVRGELSITGYSDADGDWAFGGYSRHDPYRLTLPTENGDLVCGEYRDAAGNVIKVEQIK